MRLIRALIVDDEPAVLRTAERIARRAGHDVVTAPDGAAALERLAADGAVDAVLMDMTMPRMNGLQTAGAIRAAGRAVPVVLMSGYAAEEIVRGDDAPIDGFLKKPFTRAELCAALDAVLAPANR